MSDAFSITGLEELRRAVDTLPAEVTADLRTIALRSAQNIHGDAQRRLRSQQKTAAHALADAITLIEDPEHKQFIVRSVPPVGQPTSLTIWNEHGTVKMPARPYMRPSVDAERGNYLRNVEHAIGRLMQRVFA